MKGILEGLLFISGDDGITLEKITNILDINTEEAINLLSKLSDDYNKDDRGLCIKKFGEKYKMVTKKEHALFYRKLANVESSEKLSNSALEVLAIIAYNGPVTRIMIDEIRGVSSAHAVRKLVFKNLVKEVGKSDLPGKPILYGVTDQFLDYFGIESLDELPKIELEPKDEELELYKSRYRE